MPNSINLSATQARQHFFEIFEQAIKNGMSFVVNHKHFAEKLLITPLSQAPAAPEEVDLDALYACLRGKKELSNETSLAHKHYAQSQKK